MIISWALDEKDDKDDNLPTDFQCRINMVNVLHLRPLATFTRVSENRPKGRENAGDAGFGAKFKLLILKVLKPWTLIPEPIRVIRELPGLSLSLFATTMYTKALAYAAIWSSCRTST